MSIWEYANPKKFMQTSAWALPWVVGLTIALLVTGLTWGFFFTPDDYKQGATVKIIYLHVPSAMMAINAWGMMLVTSLIWIVRRHHVSALAAKAAAPVGLTFTLIALVTGALWGQPMWGTWWAWDPRLTGSRKATGDKAADDAKLKKACQEMESVFLNMLLKSMRDTVPKTEIGGNNKQTDIIQSMLDTELTRNMAAAGGTGLAAMMYRNLSNPGVVHPQTNSGLKQSGAK